MDTSSVRVPIAFVDDHPIYRQGLANVFRAEERFKVVAEGDHRPKRCGSPLTIAREYCFLI